MAVENSNSKPANTDRLVFRPRIGPAGDVLVAIFLRGGMDGVYTIPPFGDRAFQIQRKAFGFAEPKPNGLINLDDFFGFHPDFAPLESLYRERQLAIVNAVGLTEPMLSHFDATKAIERGTPLGRVETGWIGRHLAATDPALQSTAGSSIGSPLRALALGHGIPPVLYGSKAQALDSIADFRLEVPAGWDPGFTRVLRQMYAPGNDLASSAGRETLATLKVLQRLARSRLPARELGPLFAGHFWQPSQPGRATHQGRCWSGSGRSQPCRLGQPC